jgi:cyclopropane-fatty-acyl-phospholipid synthase
VRTLDLWRETLLEKRAEILALGFDATFLRSWEYYFAYCRAGFAAQTIDLAHMVLTRPDREG